MMIAAQTSDSAQHRLARYYLGKLRAAEAAYKQGHENSLDGLSLFDREWAQIKQWHGWVANNAAHDTAIARLCVQYTQAAAGLFSLRQHPNERLEWLEAGLRAARMLGDLQAEMVHLHLLGKTHTYLGALDTAKDFAERALTLAREMNNPLYTIKILINFGNIYYAEDEYDRSRIANEKALTLSRRLGAKLEIGAALNGLGNAAYSMGDYRRARECYSQFLEMAEANGHSYDICLALRNLSMVTRNLGDDLNAMIYAERAVALCRAIGEQVHLAESLAQLGEFAMARGNFSEARADYQESLDLSRLMSHHANETFVLHRLGVLFLATGDVSAALEYEEASLSLSKKIGERWFSAIALLSMAEAYRVTGDLQTAYVKLREGLQIALAFQSRAIRAKYLLVAARLWHDQGHVGQAALWAGLLREKVSEFSPEQRSWYNDLCLRLTDTLSQDEFDVTMQRGKSLDLDSVIEDVFAALSSQTELIG